MSLPPNGTECCLPHGQGIPPPRGHMGALCPNGIVQWRNGKRNTGTNEAAQGGTVRQEAGSSAGQEAEVAEVHEADAPASLHRPHELALPPEDMSISAMPACMPCARAPDGNKSAPRW